MIWLYDVLCWVLRSDSFAVQFTTTSFCLWMIKFQRYGRLNTIVLLSHLPRTESAFPRKDQFNSIRSANWRACAVKLQLASKNLKNASFGNWFQVALANSIFKLFFSDILIYYQANAERRSFIFWMIFSDFISLHHTGVGAARSCRSCSPLNVRKNCKNQP